MEDRRELTLDEMEDAVGGKGGSRKRLREKKGYIVYRIRPGDTLNRIASVYGTTAKEIMDENPTISNINEITAGYYIYIAY